MKRDTYRKFKEVMHWLVELRQRAEARQAARSTPSHERHRAPPED